MAIREAEYLVELGFLPGEHAIPDAEHPGLLRAGERASAPYGRDGVEFHRFVATDCHQRGSDGDLLAADFATVDLSSFPDLQAVFARVRAAGELTDADATAIRAGLEGATLRCSDGTTLEVMALAGEGLFLRKSGPNRMSVVAPEPNGMNEHGAAASVHADQDVFGTPLTQIMDGRAPTLFRHDTPGARNHESTLMLLNLWVPLQQITQPLVLADGRSLDRTRQQLRYGLPTTSFLDRDDDMAINDIWAFLPDESQRWYFRSEMDHRSAYVFNTLSTPHGAGVLPGEDVAEACYRSLEQAEAAAERGDADALVEALSALASRAPTETTPALRWAIDDMLAVADDALVDPVSTCGASARDWVRRSRGARNRVVRMSVELRLVASVAEGAVA